MKSKPNYTNKLSDAELLELENYYIKVSKTKSLKIKNKEGKLLFNIDKKQMN